MISAEPERGTEAVAGVLSVRPSTAGPDRPEALLRPPAAVPESAESGIALTLAEAGEALEATLHGPDRAFRGVCIDSRRVMPGTLFVALRGERFDAHGFLDRALAAGAVGALVERVGDPRLAQLRVGDTRIALGRLAAHWRDRFERPLVAITGSNGKTTVKEMLGSILRCGGPTLVTRGNLNNDIGVPLTLFRLHAGQRYAVVEMGANHPGEIGYLTALAQPDVAVVTNAGPAHLEGFGDLAGVARAKGELFSGLGAAGIAVINADDAYAPLWRELADCRRVLSFGLREEADVGAWIERQEPGRGVRFRLLSEAGEVSVRLALEGRHNVMNALAAAAAGLAVGMRPAAVRAGLEAVAPVAGRLQRRTLAGGVELIDDTYNANPASVQVALEVLAASPGPRLLVLGDMAEMGPEAVGHHADLGREAARLGITRLYAVGSLSRRAVEQFHAGGEYFETVEALVEALGESLVPGSTVLVKGSRRAGMERVVEALTRAAAERDEAWED
jgi:UDP-N-acetylmuramoyl-tripeptide--D-alanyl-D-alanine ligase